MLTTIIMHPTNINFDYNLSSSRKRSIVKHCVISCLLSAAPRKKGRVSSSAESAFLF